MTQQSFGTEVMAWVVPPIDSLPVETMHAQCSRVVNLHEFTARHLEAASLGHVEHRFLSTYLIETVIVPPKLKDHRGVSILIGGFRPSAAE